MDMKKMMKQAQKMQRDLAIAQEEIKSMEFEASAGGGMVKAVAAGDGSVKSLEIAPDAVDPEDVEMLQDMVIAAVNEALRGVAEMGNQRMAAWATWACRSRRAIESAQTDKTTTLQFVDLLRSSLNYVRCSCHTNPARRA